MSPWPTPQPATIWPVRTEPSCGCSEGRRKTGLIRSSKRTELPGCDGRFKKNRPGVVSSDPSDGRNFRRAPGAEKRAVGGRHRKYYTGAPPWSPLAPGIDFSPPAVPWGRRIVKIAWRYRRAPRRGRGAWPARPPVAGGLAGSVVPVEITVPARLVRPVVNLPSFRRSSPRSRSSWQEQLYMEKGLLPTTRD